MTAKAKCVLGISPGTRTVGLAVILDGELVEWKVKTFTEQWTNEKQRAILETIRRLCDYYSVQLITMKKVDPLRSSPELDALVKNMMRQAKRLGIRTRSISLSELDYDLRRGKRQRKRDISERVAETHPEVRHEYAKERNNRREYYTKMFEAIAMAEQFRQ